MAKASWATRVSTLIENLRVSQADLAALIGTDPSTVWRWVSNKGEPPSHPTQRIVEALEEIVATEQVESFFRTMRAKQVRPNTREMLELIFFFSGGRRYIR